MPDYFFSIIIPTFNRAHVVGRAIDSVLNQQFQNFELIVVDDGGTDDTRKVLNEKYPTRLTYVYQENSGVCKARNYGASLATGKFLIFLDSDDWLSENCLEAYSEALTLKNAKVVMGVISYCDENSSLIKKIEPRLKGEHYGQGLTGSFAIDRQTFLDMNGYDVNLAFAENSDLFLRMRTIEHISHAEIVVTAQGGVCILKESNQIRRNRYSEKKFLSVKYFLKKHQLFFESSAKDYMNFSRVLAFSALYSGHPREARAALTQIISRHPSSVKTYFQLAIFCFPVLAKLYYGRS